MANVLSTADVDKIYKHEGFSDTITDSYASPSTTPRGIEWDNANVLSADRAAHTHYKHSGFSATITASYSTGADATPTGIAWDGTHVLSADHTTDKHYKHSGFSATITDSYSTPSGSPEGVAWDGTNLLSTDPSAAAAYVGTHYKHSGFSATIIDSYTSGAMPETVGITWDGTNVLSTDIYADKHFKHSGFSATITDSYARTDSRGIAWESVSGGASYNVALTIAQVLTITPNEFELNTTYTTIPIVRKRLRYIDSNLGDSDIEQYIYEAEGIIDAVMTDSMKDIFDAIKHDAIRACATDLAALQVLAYDPSVQPTIEAALMTADLLFNSSQETLRLISNPRNVKYWRSL